MTVLIEKEYEKPLGFAYEEVAHKVIEAVIDYEECPYEVEVSITLTDDDEIRQVNSQFRNIDQVTDVLSFPMVPFSFPADYGIIKDEYFHPDTGELILGDIMVAVPRMKQQACDYGHSDIREYAFLITHSMLHLLGYDHMTEDEASKMEIRQEEILNQLEIKR